MSRSLTTLVLSAGVGACAAVITVVLLNQFAERERPSTQPNTAPSRVVSPQTHETRTVLVQTESTQLRELQEDIAALRAQQKPVETEESMPDLEQATQRADAQFAELERLHQQDPVDPAWSASASRSLGADLTKLGDQRGFVIRQADCRTTSCRAAIEWKDYQSAMATGLHLAEEVLPGFNCAQRIYLKAPSDPLASYSANLYLDCASQRAGQVEVASSQQ